MIGTNLFEIINSFPTPPNDKDLNDFKIYVTEHINEVNTEDESHKTPAHYAAEKDFHLLAILALDGKATIPDDIPDPSHFIAQLREEQKFGQDSKPFRHNFHLHQMLRRSLPVYFSIKRVAKNHPHQINERSFLNRNACHWAAIDNNIECLKFFADNEGDFTALDLYNKTPLDLITEEACKKEIEEYLQGKKDFIFNKMKAGGASEPETSSGKIKRPTSPTRTQEKSSSSAGNSLRSGSPPPETSEFKTTFSGKIKRALSPTRAEEKPSSDANNSLRSGSPPPEASEPKTTFSGKIKRALSPTRAEERPSSSASNSLRSSSPPPETDESKTTFSGKIKRALSLTRADSIKPFSSASNSRSGSPPPEANEFKTTISSKRKRTMSLEGKTSSNVSTPIRSVSPTKETHPHYATLNHPSNKKLVKRKRDRSQSLKSEDKKLTNKNQSFSTTSSSALDHYGRTYSIQFSSVFSSPEELESKLLLQSLHEVVVPLFKDDALEKFKHVYISRKINVNDLIPIIGKPYLIQALLAQAEEIFIFLIEQGANFTTPTAEGKYFEDYLQDEKAADRAAFLNKIISYFKAQPIIKDYQVNIGKLISLDNDFGVKLIQKGLVSQSKCKNVELSEIQLETVCQKAECSIEIGQIIYQICSRTLESQQEGAFDPRLIRQYVLGLLAVSSGRTLIILLQNLLNFFDNQQKCIALFIIKEIILVDELHHSYYDETFCGTVLPTFTSALSVEEQSNFSNRLEDLISYQKKIHHPIITTITQLEFLLAHYDASRKEVPLDNYEHLAKDLKAITYEFYTTLNLEDLIYKPQVNGEQLALAIREQISQFNKLSQYFVLTILKAPSAALRQSYTRTLILAADELITSSIPDFNTAMAISSALENIRLENELKQLQTKDEKTFKRWQEIKETLSPQKNYAVMRQHMTKAKPCALHYFGLYKRDLVFSGENQILKNMIEIKGMTLLEFMEYQNKVKEIPAFRPHSQLTTLLSKQKEMSANEADDTFLILANEINPKPIRLDEQTTFSIVMKIIGIYSRKSLPLKVLYEGKVTEDFQAVQALFNWLEEVFEERRVSNIYELSELIDTLYKWPEIKSSVEMLDANFMRKLKSSPEPLTIQFSQLRLDSQKKKGSFTLETDPNLKANKEKSPRGL